MPRIDAFLKLGTAQGCSDIHLAVGVPPMLRMNGTGMTTSASRPMATVAPDATTARPAVFMVRTMASSPSYPCARSSRHRVTMSSE